MKAAHPELGALVLECTNMTPYAAAIRAAINLPIFTAAGFVAWFHSGLAPREYPMSGSIFGHYGR